MARVKKRLDPKLQGKPPKIDMSSEELLAEVKKYIEKCKENMEYPNVAGLCVYLDVGRSTYYEYRRSYAHTFEKVDQLLEDAAINSRYATDGLKMFYMKNKCGYTDRVTADIKASVTIEDFFKENEIDF